MIFYDAICKSNLICKISQKRCTPLSSLPAPALPAPARVEPVEKNNVATATVMEIQPGKRQMIEIEQSGAAEVRKQGKLQCKVTS